MSGTTPTGTGTEAADSVARLAEYARLRDPDALLASVLGASPETIGATARSALLDVTALVGRRRGAAAGRSAGGCAAVGYETGRLVLGTSSGAPARGSETVDAALAREMLVRVSAYGLPALEKALGPLAERPLASIASLDPATQGTARKAFRVGIGVALAEFELATTGLGADGV